MNRMVTDTVTSLGRRGRWFESSPAPPTLRGSSSAAERVRLRVELFLRFTMLLGVVKPMLLVKDFGYFLIRAQFEPVRNYRKIVTGA